MKIEMKSTVANRFPWTYFALVFLLAVPFWVFGEQKLPLPVNLPVSALVALVPALAAVIFSFQRYGSRGIQDLFKRAADVQKIRKKVWILVALGLGPLIYSLSYVVMRLAGMPLPEPEIPWLIAPVYFLVYFIFAVGEELGWTAVATDPLQNRLGALVASLLLGLIWAAWHLIPFVQTDNSPTWIFWQSIQTVLLRVLIVWIYNSAGKSVLAAILYHAASNVSWSLFPNDGSHYNPFVMVMVMSGVLAVILILWDAKTFDRFRLARQPRESKDIGS